MHLFEFAFFMSGVIYALVQEQMLLFYFLLIVGIYLLLSIIRPGGIGISNRKKIMVSTWDAPGEGVIHLKTQIRAEKINKICEASSPDLRITPTHFIIKACG